jgi:hypothetical protein
LNLPGGRSRKLSNEFDHSCVFIGRQAFIHECLQGCSWQPVWCSSPNIRTRLRVEEPESPAYTTTVSR